EERPGRGRELRGGLRDVLGDVPALDGTFRANSELGRAQGPENLTYPSPSSIPHETLPAPSGRRPSGGSLRLGRLALAAPRRPGRRARSCSTASRSSATS